MINSKQRSYLKGLANTIEPILNIGKYGISDNLIRQVDEALEARELIKIKVLNNSLLDSKACAIELAEKTNSEFVQSIGNKFVLYRQANDKKTIRLP